VSEEIRKAEMCVGKSSDCDKRCRWTGEKERELGRARTNGERCGSRNAGRNEFFKAADVVLENGTQAEIHEIVRVCHEK
jgi:hypothetical protein